MALNAAQPAETASTRQLPAFEPSCDNSVTTRRAAHNATMAKQAKTILHSGLQRAVMANVLSANPVRDVQPLRANSQPKRASALTAEQLRRMLTNVAASERCRELDLVDPITVLAATGLRESELLGLRWVDFDAAAGTLTVTGKLVRATGYGLTRIDDTKSAAGKRTRPLARFAVDALTARRRVPFLGEQAMIFPSTAGTWRDPNNFNKQWRQVRDTVGGAGVTTHSFRKTVANLIDGGGLSARIGADHLGHTNVSMTHDRYMARGRSHIEVADLEKHPLKWGGRGSNPRPMDYESTALTD